MRRYLVTLLFIVLTISLLSISTGDTTWKSSSLSTKVKSTQLLKQQGLLTPGMQFSLFKDLGIVSSSPTTTSTPTTTTTPGPVSKPVVSPPPPSVTVTTAPVAPPPVVPETTPTTTPAVSTDGVTPEQYAAWTKVAVCEEGGWIGYAGPAYPDSLGISAVNWAAYGGTSDLSPNAQIIVAERIQSNPPDANGCAAW